MKMFLCSHFSSVGSLIKEEIENKKVAFIPTASLREGYTGYVGSARKLFKKLGAIVTEIDISTEAYSTIQSVFEDADVIYFTGGNSFFLIDQLRKTGTDELLKKELAKGKLMIGESAGAIICAPSIQYIEHTEAKDEGDVLSLHVLVAGIEGLVDTPDDTCHKADDIDNLTCVERTAEHVDEEQLKPSAHGDDAWYDTIQYGKDYEEGHDECNQGTLEVGLWHLLIVIYQYDGRDAKQVEQVDTNTQTSHIGDEHEPSVAMRFVGVVFPLQYQPENDCCEGRREGIYLTLHGREPEGIAEGVDECAHHT